jgi:TrmH family RNA methyltransferase
MSTITSLHNPHVRSAVRLRDRRHRQRHGRILIDGARELGRALAAGVRLVEVFICPALCQSGDARRVVAALAD